ncbi:MAG: antibiotic biosynthesis monooxygenase [bacterium]|nr:antibiotic biosynthesis monooxygenase [bacterium]
MNQAVELIRFRVTEPHVNDFLSRRAAVDEALRSFEGFLGSELIQVSGEQWLLIVRWQNREAAVAAQAVTTNMTVITDWINIADEFLSFDTSDVRYSSVVQQTSA